MNKATKSQKSDNKTAKVAGILVLLAVVILVILLLLRGCGSKDAELPAQPETGTGISYDSAAVIGGWDEADMDKLVANGHVVSALKTREMSRLLAPMARRIPISFVRSSTEM